MAHLFTRTTKNGQVKYYGNIQYNGKRVRKYLGFSKETAGLALKQLEYNLLFKKDTKEDIDRKL